jgi:DMSO reductase family type II enzyme heme b subunit
VNINRKTRKSPNPLAAALALSAIASTGASAAAPPASALDSETIAAFAHAGTIPLAASAPAWNAARALMLKAHPQMSVRLNDRDANASMEAASPIEVQVKALVSGSELGLWMEWKDSTRSLVSPVEVASFGDSAAVQFPEKFGKDRRLPHIGMGDEGAPVRVYLQRATEGGMRLAEYVAKGFGSLTRTTRAHAKMKMDYDEKSGVWRAVMVRPLVAARHSLSSGVVPVSFAFWDGAGRQRGGNKFLSSWKFLRLPRFPANEAYLKQVAWGFGGGAAGSIEAGREKFGQLCVSCHRVSGNENAIEGMAPDLHNIGAISTPGYLRDSIVNPSEVVMRNLQINRHYAEFAEPDANRAYPNNEMYLWYVDLPGGKKLSRMPALNLPEKDVTDLVAYLRTQDGTISSQGR